MQFLRVPAPFPSTVISLAPAEQFTYRNHRIQSVTIDPLAPTHPYTLSGISRIRQNHQAFGVSELPSNTPELLRTQAAQELRRFAFPSAPARAAHPDAQAVRAPAPPPSAPTAAPAPGELQPPRARTVQVPAQKQHLAAPLTPAPSAHKPAPGAHRAGR